MRQHHNTIQLIWDTAHVARHATEKELEYWDTDIIVKGYVKKPPALSFQLDAWTSEGGLLIPLHKLKALMWVARQVVAHGSKGSGLLETLRGVKALFPIHMA